MKSYSQHLCEKQANYYARHTKLSGFAIVLCRLHFESNIYESLERYKDDFCEKSAA